MRFGLSDLQELPSLKEFEALAREALGSDMGVAPTTEEEMLAQPAADTVENLTGASQAEPNPLTADLAENDQLVPTEFATSSSSGAPGSGSEPESSTCSSAHQVPTDEEFLHEREVESTAEGMPSGELDEEPPKAEAAASGE